MENSKDLSQITLAEVLHAFQAQEQRRLMRQEGSTEGAFQVKWQNNNGGGNKKKKQNNYNKPGGFNKNNNQKNSTQAFPPCPHCKKTNHPKKWCWWRLDARCAKCGQQGHVEKICKSHQ